MNASHQLHRDTRCNRQGPLGSNNDGDVIGQSKLFIMWSEWKCLNGHNVMKRNGSAHFLSNTLGKLRDLAVDVHHPSVGHPVANFWIKESLSHTIFRTSASGWQGMGSYSIWVNSFVPQFDSFCYFTDCMHMFGDSDCNPHFVLPKVPEELIFLATSAKDILDTASKSSYNTYGASGFMVEGLTNATILIWTLHCCNIGLLKDMYWWSLWQDLTIFLESNVLDPELHFFVA